MSATRLLIIEHILVDRSFEIGWFPEELAEGALGRSVQRDLRAFELRWKPADARDDEWHAIRRRFEQIAIAVSQRMGWNLELVLLEAKAAPPSRVRSHKGLLRPLGFSPDDDALELELPVESNLSLLAASIPVSGANTGIALAQAWDSARAAVLVLDPSERPQRERWLRAILDCADLTRTIFVSQTKVIVRMTPDVAGVLRLVHPASESHVSLVWFVLERELRRLREATEDVLAEGSARPLSERA